MGALAGSPHPLVPPCLPDPGSRDSRSGEGVVLAPGEHSPWWVGGYLCTVALTEVSVVQRDVVALTVDVKKYIPSSGRGCCAGSM